MTVEGSLTGMDDSGKKSEARKKDKKKIAQMIKSRLSKRERIFLTICDLMTVTIVLVDLMFFIDFVKISNLMILTLLNIGIVGLSYFSYKFRKKVRRTVLKELIKTGRSETSEEDAPANK
jgi:hypothetical protein